MDNIVFKCVEPVNDNSDTEKEIKFVVISKVLCYTHYYLQSCAPDNVKAVVITSFSEDDITCAKRFLWTLPGKEMLGECHERKKSTNRSVAEANTNDIIEAMQCVDQNKMPLVFTVSDLRDLPSFSPEEINSVALIKRIELLERKYSDIENTSSQHQIELCTLTNTMTKQAQEIKTAENTIETHTSLIGSLQSEKRDSVPGQCSVCTEIEISESSSDASGGDDSSDTADANDEEVADDKSPKLQNGTSNGTGGAGSMKKSLAERVAKKSKEPIRNPPKRLNARSHKQLYSAALQSQKPRNGFNNRDNKGTKHKLHSASSNHRTDGNGFITPRNHWRKSLLKIYIGNVNRKHSVDDVFDFLQSKKMKVTGLYQRSHFTAMKKSFVCLLSSRDFNALKNDMDCKQFEIREYTNAAPAK